MYRKNNIIYNKSFEFAIEIVNLYKMLANKKKEFVMSKQILRSGTSVGANVREADNAESKADFIHKMSIAQKEADESIYWLELLYRTYYIEKETFENLYKNAVEIIKIIKAINITSKKNRK